MDEEAETESKDNTSKESTENPVKGVDFEVFYYINKSGEEGLSPHLAVTLVSEDQEAIKVPKGMVIEKRLPYLLSLLESHARTTTLEVLIVPRPPTPIPPAPTQTKPTDKK